MTRISGLPRGFDDSCIDDAGVGHNREERERETETEREHSTRIIL